jgi:hypothetical protein
MNMLKTAKNKLISLLDELPNFNWFVYKRCAERAVPRFRHELQEIIDRRMGDVIDWLRLTPNAL